MADSTGLIQELASFLAARDDDDADERLGELLARHAVPLVEAIVARRLGNVRNEVEDVCSVVVLQLMQRLRREREVGGLAAINSFSNYVATAAHHGCDHYIRARYPHRWRLRNRIRHVLDTDRRFAVWKAADGPWVCGRAAWHGRGVAPQPRSHDALGSVRPDDVPGLLAKIFPTTGGPLELNAVVDAAASAWGVPLHQHDDNAAIETAPTREARIDQVIEQRAWLSAAWTHICDLPLRQRHALLLNLRDDALTLFLTTGVLALRDIAAALELPVDAFAALWNDLPLQDNVIAERLGCTRQQVINLRLAARRRLANRLRPDANMGRVLAL